MADHPAERSAIQGVGIGLRSDHFGYILEHLPPVPWFEILTDNYLGDGGPLIRNVERIREHYPVTFHGVGMALGDSEPLNLEYLSKVDRLAQKLQPAWISDHLCWCSKGGHNSHDLLPLPYTEETVKHVAARIRQAQDVLGRRLVVENVSSYVAYRHSQMSEWAFLTAVAEEADCDVLLDINNIYVSARNHGFDARDYLRNAPHARVREMHLAGYEDHGTHLLDTHSRPVHEPVWELYAQALEFLPEVPTLLEWDNDIPPFQTLMTEATKAERLHAPEASHAD